MPGKQRTDPKQTGYLSQAEAYICVYQCDPRTEPGRRHADHRLGCYVGGNVRPIEQRCALERYLYARQQANGHGPQVPRGYMTVNQIVERFGLKQETLLHRIGRGVYPGALKMRKRADSKEWLWIVLEAEVSAHAG